MLSKVINHIVETWEESGITEKKDREIYVYGLDLFLSAVINTLIVITMAVLCGKMKETLVLLCVVFPLQAFCGGYHAKTHLRCFLILFIGWWIIMPLISFMTPEFAIATSLISIVLIYIFAPIPHVNVPMSKKRKYKMRILSRLAGTIIVVFIFLFLFVFSKYIYIGIVMASGLGIISFSMFCSWVKAFCFN